MKELTHISITAIYYKPNREAKLLHGGKSTGFKSGDMKDKCGHF